MVTNERKTVAVILVVEQIESTKKAVCHASFSAISIVSFFMFNHITIADMLTLKSRLSLPRDIGKNAIDDVIKPFTQKPILVWSLVV